MLPDVTVNVTSAAAPRSQPTNTGQNFAVGQTQRGSSLNPMLLTNKSDFDTLCGARIAASNAADWVETYFSEGGAPPLWFSRLLGTGAVQATASLMDNAAAISLNVKAGCNGDPDPGVWANGATGGLSVAVLVTGTQYQLQVFLGGKVVETSPLFSTQADAVGWASGVNKGLFSRYLQITLGASLLNPVAVAAPGTNLATGADGSAIATADHQAAHDRIPKELGPGQITDIGAVTAAINHITIDHAVKRNRFALIDAPDTATDTTVVAAAAALYGANDGLGRRRAQMFWPWEVIPGLTTFTTRTVPPTARAAADFAKTDALGNPAQAPAGRFGKAQFVQDLSQPKLTDAQREELNNAGVTVSRRRFGGSIVRFGIRTLADQVNDKDWSFVGGVRTVMAYIAQALVVGENHFADVLDAQNSALADYRADLMAPAKALFDAKALFGVTPADAFYVDTGPSVNTLSTIAAGLEIASVKLRTVGAGEALVINIVKTPLNQAL